MTEDSTTAQQGEPQGEPAPHAAEPHQEPAPEPNPSQEPQPAAGAPEPGPAPADEPPKKKPWWETRLSEVSAKKNEYESRNRALEEQNAALIAALASAKGDTPPASPHSQPQPPAAQPQAPDARQPLQQQDIDKMVQQRAAEIARVQQFNEACNRSYNAGKSEFSDFDEAVRNLGMVGALGENGNPAFLEIVTEMPEGHKVLHHLGKNLDDAARLVNLPPTKLAVELARLESTLNQPATPKPISNAPAPVRTIDGKGKAEARLDDDKLPIDKWMELRRQQKAARAKR